MLKVNEYFDGNVKSIAFDTETLSATVGVMRSGEYQFDTSKFETMTVISGLLEVLLPDSQEWEKFSAGTSFDVAAGKSFQLKVLQNTAYFCTYA